MASAIQFLLYDIPVSFVSHVVKIVREKWLPLAQEEILTIWSGLKQIIAVLAPLVFFMVLAKGEEILEIQLRAASYCVLVIVRMLFALAYCSVLFTSAVVQRTLLDFISMCDQLMLTKFDVKTRTSQGSNEPLTLTQFDIKSLLQRMSDSCEDPDEDLSMEDLEVSKLMENFHTISPDSMEEITGLANQNEDENLGIAVESEILPHLHDNEEDLNLKDDSKSTN